MINQIRNFSIIAHIDHGKSTLADRMLEITKTVDIRKMKEQFLDSMELEREKGITIKMTPVTMNYVFEGKNYILNLIDTPGHIDFSYEVSRAIKAVEGAILLVDATQGVQAQTFSVLGMAKDNNLVIIPVISKIDSPLAQIEKTKKEIISILNCKPEEILEVSGKLGTGVENLLKQIIFKIPPPKVSYIGDNPRGLIFDFEYSNHQGVIVYLRVLDGIFKKNMDLEFFSLKEKFKCEEIGIFSPFKKQKDFLKAGEIGYLVTGIKKPGICSVGDTIVSQKNPLPPFPGYMSPKPVVWASFYPENQDDFNHLKNSLEKLKLSDPSLLYQEESSVSLGRGFQCGFLGMLHLEIITERLKREHNLSLIVTQPSINFKVIFKDGSEKIIYSAYNFPDEYQIKEVFEPWINAKIIIPSEFLSSLISILYNFEAQLEETQNFTNERILLKIKMPLRELMRNFFDELKSISQGHASISYEIIGFLPAQVTRMDVLIADKVVPAFSKVISRKKIKQECEEIVEKLHKLLPRQLFVLKIQAKVDGKIISSRSLAALKKDVTGYLYGGDRTRKMKLWEKQKRGKKKLKKLGKVNIPKEVFLNIYKK